jgi:hypothetical protein
VRTHSPSLQTKWDKLIIRSPFSSKSRMRCRLNGRNVCLCQVGHCGNGAEHATFHLFCAGSSDSFVTGARSNNQGTKLPRIPLGYYLSDRQYTYFITPRSLFFETPVYVQCSYKCCQKISRLHVIYRHPYNSLCSCARNKFLVSVSRIISCRKIGNQCNYMYQILS